MGFKFLSIGRLSNELEAMIEPAAKRKSRNELCARSVMDADAEQWRQWLSLSPADRLEAASRLWMQSREFSKHAKRNLSLALRARAARV